MKICRCVVLLVLFWIFGITNAPSVFAAALTNANVRLERNKSATAPGNILIVAQTNENVTESSVKVVVPSAWTISSSASNFTVSTANLPSGVTAWPGISTATSVSGQQIIFPSSDITSGTKYGFFITGGIGTNPTVSSQTSYQWTISTQVSSVDSSTVGLGVPVSLNDQIAISASIIPNASYYTAQIDSTTANTTINQNTTLDFTITYGMTYSANSPLTLQASWDLGTVSGSGSSVDIFSYVVGSASNAYGGTAPVIDTVNRTITWTIAEIPANTTNQTVTFSLLANAGFTGSQTVDLPVHAQITYPTSSAVSTVSHTYQYYSTVTPTPTPLPQTTEAEKKSCNLGCATDTECSSGYCHMEVQRCRSRDYPNSEQCSAPGQTTPTPTPTASTLVHSLEVVGVTDQTITVEVQLNTSTQVDIQYGFSPNVLDQVERSSVAAKKHTFILKNLRPATDYYLRAMQPGTNLFLSDIFHVKTATQGSLLVGPSKVLLSAQGIPLFQTIVNSTVLSVVIPKETQSELNVFYSENFVLDEATIFAIRSNGQRVSLGSLVFSNSGVLTGKFIVPKEQDLYQLFLRIKTPYGELSEVKVVDIVAVEKLMVIDKRTRQPIERAAVTFFQHDSGRQLYKELPAPSFLPTNPLFSNPLGEVDVALSPGLYKIEVTAYNYVPKTIEFRLVGFDKDRFPLVELDSLGWNPVRWTIFFGQTLQYWLEQLLLHSKTFSQSQALFQASAFISMTILTVLSVLSLQAKMLLSMRQMISHLLLHSSSLLPNGPSMISGTVMDKETKKPLAQCRIRIISEKKKTILADSITSRTGTFHIRKPSENFLIEAEAIGYIPSEAISFKDDTTLELLKKSSMKQAFIQNLKEGMSVLFGFSFETFLILSVVAQLFFIQYLGLPKVLPFVGVSCLNAALWAHQILTHLFRRF